MTQQSQSDLMSNTDDAGIGSAGEVANKVSRFMAPARLSRQELLQGIRESLQAEADERLGTLDDMQLRRIHHARRAFVGFIDIAVDFVAATEPGLVDFDASSQLDRLRAGAPQRGRRMTTEEIEAQQGVCNAAAPPASHVAAAEFGMQAGQAARQTVDRWRNQARVIALPRTGRGYLYPLDQLDENNQIPRGLSGLISAGGNGHALWRWLSSPHPQLGHDTPINALKAGKIEQVTGLYEAILRGDFD